MNKKEFKKNFIQNFKNENNPNIRFEDTFKTTEEQKEIYYNKYMSLIRRHRLSTIFSCVLIFLLIVGLTITLLVYKDDKRNSNSNFELTEEEYAYCLTICDKIYKVPFTVIQYEKDEFLIIYQGNDLLGKDDLYNYYFCKAINLEKNIFLQYQDTFIEISNDNNLSYFTKVKIEEELVFYIKYNENVKKYVIS